MTDDPTRLLDEGPNELRALLDAGRAEVPTERQVAALALKLGAIMGAGGAAGGGAAAAAGAAKAGAAKAVAGAVATKGIATGLAVKITAAAVVASVAAGGTAYVVHEKRAAAPAPTVVGLVATHPASSGLATPSPARAPIPIPTPDPVATVARAPSAAPADPADDFGLVDRAQKAGSAERALELCNEHARKFPNGSFAQEREVIAIKSLVELGRRPEAEARARRFSARFPGSAQQRRVDAILGF